MGKSKSKSKSKSKTTSSGRGKSKSTRKRGSASSRRKNPSHLRNPAEGPPDPIQSAANAQNFVKNALSASSRVSKDQMVQPPAEPGLWWHGAAPDSDQGVTADSSIPETNVADPDAITRIEDEGGSSSGDKSERRASYRDKNKRKKSRPRGRKHRRKKHSGQSRDFIMFTPGAGPELAPVLLPRGPRVMDVTSTDNVDDGTRAAAVLSAISSPGDALGLMGAMGIDTRSKSLEVARSIIAEDIVDKVMRGEISGTEARLASERADALLQGMDQGLGNDLHPTVLQRFLRTEPPLTAGALVDEEAELMERMSKHDRRVDKYRRVVAARDAKEQAAEAVLQAQREARTTSKESFRRLLERLDDDDARNSRDIERLQARYDTAVDAYLDALYN